MRHPALPIFFFAFYFGYLALGNPVPITNYGLSAQFGESGVGAGKFRLPYGTVIDKQNKYLYVSDCHNASVQKFKLDGTFISMFGAQGSKPGEFYNPADLILAPNGDIYVVEEVNNRVQRFDKNGNHIGTFGEEELDSPLGIAINSKQELFVTSYHAYEVVVYDLSGKLLRRFGKYGDGPGEMKGPYYIEVDSKDNVFVVDRTSDRIQKYDRMGKFLLEWGGKGKAAGKFDYPHEISIDRLNRVYVTDTFNHRFQVFDNDGKFLVQFGDASIFSYPKALSVDRNFNVYVGDRYNSIGQFTVWKPLAEGEPPPISIPIYPAGFPKYLTGWNLYGGFPSLFAGNDSHLYFYEPEWPLWTNGAIKTRHAHLYRNTKINNSGKVWEYPEDMELFKTFSYKEVGGKTRHIETRVIQKTGSKWLYARYRWNDQQTDAVLLPNDTEIEVPINPEVGKPFKHVIPTRGQCSACHGGNVSNVIGISEIQLNSMLPGHNKTQLEEWAEKGLLTSPLPVHPQEIVGTKKVPQEVMGYVFGNCVHCHNSTTPLSFEPADFEKVINKQGHYFPGVLVFPGYPASSTLYQLVSAGKMPPLGVQLPDDPAIHMFKEWIANLK